MSQVRLFSSSKAFTAPGIKLLIFAIVWCLLVATSSSATEHPLYSICQALPDNAAINQKEINSVDQAAGKSDQSLDVDLNTQLKHGAQQRHQSDYAGAEETFKAAYRKAQSSSSDENYQVKPLEALAGLYRAMGRLDESESLYRKALQILDHNPKAEEQVIATACDNLGLVCAQRGKLEDAEQLSKRALSIYENSAHTKKVDLATAFNNLGLLQTDQRKYSDAEASFEKVIQLAKTSDMGNNRLLLPTAMDNLAGVYLKSGQLDKAEAKRKEALAAFEKAAGPNNPEVASCLSNLAAVYFKQKKFEQALPLLKRAEQIDESKLGIRNRTTFHICRDYVFVLKLTGHNKELLEFHDHLTKALAASAPSGAPSAVPTVHSTSVH